MGKKPAAVDKRLAKPAGERMLPRAMGTGDEKRDSLVGCGVTEGGESK